MQEISRREFIEKSFGAVCTYFLFETLFKLDLLAKNIAPLTKHWATALNELCLDLRSQFITLVQWQERVETL